MRDYLLKRRNIYLGITVFCIVFAAIYEIFSHGVYSGYMIFAFCFPLCGVVLPYTLLARRISEPVGEEVFALWQSAILTWMMGSLFTGVLRIYGTTNSLAAVYPIAGAVLAGAAGVIYGMKKR